jgi:hypothetical protein
MSNTRTSQRVRHFLRHKSVIRDQRFRHPKSGDQKAALKPLSFLRSKPGSVSVTPAGNARRRVNNSGSSKNFVQALLALLDQLLGGRDHFFG